MVLHLQTARLRCHDVHSLLLEVHEYKGNLGLNETSHVGAPIGDSIELQPGEGARELAWQSRTKTRTATSLCRGTRPSCPGDYRK